MRSKSFHFIQLDLFDKPPERETEVAVEREPVATEGLVPPTAAEACDVCRSVKGRPRRRNVGAAEVVDSSKFDRIDPSAIPYMSRRCPNYLAERRDVSSNAKGLYALVMDFYDRMKGFAESGCGRFGAEWGLSPNTVRAGLRELQVKGWVRLEQQKNGQPLRIYPLDHPGIAAWVEKQMAAGRPAYYKPFTPAKVGGVENEETCSTPATDGAEPLQNPGMTPPKSAPHRDESETNTRHDSPARAAPVPSTGTLARDTSKTRARSSGKNPKRFARVEEDVDDDVWRDLCRAVGPQEMRDNGAMWKKRWKLTRQSLALAVSDWKAKTPAEKEVGGGNAAAYITAAYEREKSRAKS